MDNLAKTRDLVFFGRHQAAIKTAKSSLARMYALEYMIKSQNLSKGSGSGDGDGYGYGYGRS